MTDDQADLAPIQTEAAPYRKRLIAALGRIAKPLAAHARYSLGVGDAEHVEWLCRHENCICARLTRCSTENPDGIDGIEIERRNFPSGCVFLCGREGDASLFSLARILIEESIHLADLECEDEDLIRELESNWESLSTLYEISSDLRTARNIPDILGRILDRIVAVRPNLHAILWIEKGGLLEPTVSRRAEALSIRSAKSGILSHAVIGRMPVVINDPSKAQISKDLEPELLSAEKIALAPVATRDQLLGVLEIWQEKGIGEFDAPIIQLFEALALQAGMVLEGERAYRISLEEERFRKEFEIGGIIQETLLSGRPPATLPGVQVGVLTVPSHAVDGDFFEFISSGDDCLDVFVGDVMGTGIPAALVAAAAKSDLLKAFGQLTAASLSRQLPAPKDIINYVHEHLTSQLIGIESFISLNYSRFDLRNRRVDFVDCGHPRAIHFRADQGTMEYLAGENMPIGFLPEERYSQAWALFGPDDIFLYYSDGITEASNATGELYGEERLKACIRAHADASAMDLCARIRESVAAFTGSQMVADDLTCLSVKIGSLDECRPIAHWAMEFLSQLEFLPALRAWIHGICRCVCPGNSQVADSLELALIETVTNIIRHAYGGRTNQKIMIEAEAFADRLTVTIMHWGTRFRPSAAQVHMPNPMMEHGYGLFIISKMIDKVAYYEGKYGSDCILLEKMLRKPAEGRKGMLATVENSGDVTIIRVVIDSLDAGNEKRFKKEVVASLAPGSKVVLDLSEVEFIDSSGLGVILSCYRHACAAKGGLKLCCLSEQVRTLVELVRMHRIFDIYETRDEALSSFNQPS